MCTGKTRERAFSLDFDSVSVYPHGDATVEMDHAKFLGSLSFLQWLEKNQESRIGCETLQPFSDKRLH